MRNLFRNRHFGSGSCRLEILGRSSVLRFLDLASGEAQTEFMAHIYFSFDFAKDEKKLQQARHKLEGWKQAFRLDKKLLYKLEREQAASDGAAAAPAKAEKEEKPAKGKGKAKAAADEKKEAEAGAEVKLLVRLAFSGHEKLTEQRWVQR